MTPPYQGSPQVFWVHIMNTGEKLPEPFKKRADLQADEGPGYMYVPEPTGTTKRGSDGGDPRGGGCSSSDDERRRSPKGKRADGVTVTFLTPVPIRSRRRMKRTQNLGKGGRKNIFER